MTANKISGRGRPRSFDRDEALETAIRLFQSRGYDSVGVAELVAELGIKPPSFYSAFGSKAGLLEQAMTRYAEGEANVFERAREGGGSVPEVIERTLHNAARRYTEEGGAGCLVLDGIRNSADPAARALEAKAKTAAFNSLREVIAGEYAARSDQFARLLTIGLTGMSAAARDGATREDLDSFATLFAQAIHREMGKDAGTV